MKKYIAIIILVLILSLIFKPKDETETTKTEPGETMNSKEKKIFIDGLITELGLQNNQFTQTFFNAWLRVENTKARYNPLATTWKKPGSTFFNCLKKDSTGKCTIGVQNYPDIKTGIKATAQTIKLKYYAPIMAILKAGDKDFSIDEATVKAFKTWGGSSGYAKLFSQLYNEAGIGTATLS